MGRFSNMVSKAGEIVQQANQEYQRVRQQQGQQPQQQQQQPTQYGQYGHQAQYGQQQDRTQYGQPQQYHQQPYQPQHQQPPTPSSTASPTSLWQQQQQQQQQQPQSYPQPPSQPPIAAYQQPQHQIDAQQALAQAQAQQQQALQHASQELARLRQQQAAATAAAVQQAEADRQYAERLAEQFREEHEREMQLAQWEAERVRFEAEEEQRKGAVYIQQQQQQLQQQMQRLQIETETPPPVPPRPQSNIYFPPPPPPPRPAQTSGGASPVPPAGPPRPGVIHGVGQASDSSLTQASSPPRPDVYYSPPQGQSQVGLQQGVASTNPFKEELVPQSYQAPSATSLMPQQNSPHPSALASSNPFQEQPSQPSYPPPPTQQQAAQSVHQESFSPPVGSPPEIQSQQSFYPSVNKPVHSLPSQSPQQDAPPPPPPIYPVQEQTTQQGYQQPPTQQPTAQTALRESFVPLPGSNPRIQDPQNFSPQATQPIQAQSSQSPQHNFPPPPPPLNQEQPPQQSYPPPQHNQFQQQTAQQAYVPHQTQPSPHADPFVVESAQTQQPTIQSPAQQTFSPPLAQPSSEVHSRTPSITAQPPPPPRPSRTPEPPQPHPSGLKPLVECLVDPVTYGLDWLYHPDVPSFAICARCYIDHIYDTQFRNTFARTFHNDKKPRKCMFGTQRVKDRLWPDAVSSGIIVPVVEFMKKRVAIGECPQSAMIEGGNWYMTDEIPGMTMCQACYEDALMATSFGEHFKLETIATQCFCDSSTWYIERLFEDHAKTNNWTAFSEGVKTRIQLPICPKQANTKANERAWFKSQCEPTALQVCVACYYDYFYGTADETTFVRVPGGDFDTRCVMGQLNLIIPTHHSLAKKDPEIFWTATNGVDRQPLCDGTGTKGATWYTLPSDPPGFGVCGGCYAGIIQVLGGTKEFVPKPGTSKADTLLCCFNPSHHRGLTYLGAYSESLLRGDWAPLRDLATKFGDVPPCQRSQKKQGRGRRVWGWGVAAICEDCYFTVAQGTSLESRFAVHGQRDASDRDRMCDLYSPRMRSLYAQACETGDLAGFLAYGEHRHQVWCETIGVAEQMLIQQRIASMRAQMLGASGSAYKLMGGSLDATMGHHYTVGNAYAGYGHANEFVLQGHVYDRQADELRASVMNPSNVLQIGILEQRWREVE